MNRNFFKITFLGISLASAVFLPIACGSSSSPTTPANPTPTPTPFGPIIVGDITQNVTSPFAIANAIVSDSTGTTGTANTGVTVFSNGVTIPLTGGLLSNSNGETFTGAPSITGGFYSSPITYTAGQTYTFNVVISGTTYSASTTGIAGNPLVQPSSGSAGVTCSWATGLGNKNYINVQGSGLQTIVGPPIPSNPYTLANSVFTNETPGAGSDIVNLLVVQFAASVFPGAKASSCLLSTNVASANY